MTTTTAAPCTTTMKDRLMPALEKIERNARTVRRAVVRGRYATEDLAAAATLAVRRRPVRTLALAGVAGALAGCVLGYGLARRRAARRHQQGDQS